MDDGGEDVPRPATTITIAGIDLELFEDGAGAPLLFLHGGQGFNAGQPFVPLFSSRRRLIVPSHPGFGKSIFPDWLDRAADIAHVISTCRPLKLAAVDIVGARSAAGSPPRWRPWPRSASAGW